MEINFLPINSIYLVFSSLQMQRRLMQAKVYYKTFYSVGRETSHTPLKVAVARKSFSSVYIIDTTCFNECFLFHVITARHILYKFFVTQRGRRPEVFLRKGVLKICSKFTGEHLLLRTPLDGCLCTQKFDTIAMLLRSMKQVF